MLEELTIQSLAQIAGEKAHRQFMKELPNIISCISRCCFVALDFEFSGIERTNEIRKTAHVRPDIDRYYQQIAEAGRSFTILQVGITCVFEANKGEKSTVCRDLVSIMYDTDSESGIYSSRTWNFNLSPLVNTKLGINRKFCAQPDG